MTPSIQAAIERAYSDATREGSPRVVIIPTSPLLLPVDPERTALTFSAVRHEAVSAATLALLDIYQSPNYQTVREAARTFDRLADRLEFPTPEEGNHGAS